MASSEFNCANKTDKVCLGDGYVCFRLGFIDIFLTFSRLIIIKEVPNSLVAPRGFLDSGRLLQNHGRYTRTVVLVVFS